MTDAYRLLGVPTTADDGAIRAAYLAAIRDCPPERDRERFEQVRAAYEAIAHEDDRLAYSLFDTQLPTPAQVLAQLRADWQPGLPAEPHLLALLKAP